MISVTPKPGKQTDRTLTIGVTNSHKNSGTSNNVGKKQSRKLMIKPLIWEPS